MRSTILQKRFNSLGLIIVKKDVNIDKLSVLNYQHENLFNIIITC